ncbi:hypothetical protein [Sphingomonas sp. 32-62-10]|uniref:hypothetical protein n=1 Tax=Sphingomonas sp. 32-62-10 TaxID=1970436 RepID=UPI0035A84BBD
MARIRARFDLIDYLMHVGEKDTSVDELIAFQMRKIVEGTAYKRKMLSLPTPGMIGPNSEEDQAKSGVQWHVSDTIPPFTIDDYRELYRRLHYWLHESNPYVGRQELEKNDRKQLWDDARHLGAVLSAHFISIGTTAFYCELKDLTGQTRVIQGEVIVPDQSEPHSVMDQNAQTH